MRGEFDGVLPEEVKEVKTFRFSHVWSVMAMQILQK